MPNIRATQRDADRLWGVFGVALGATFVVWTVSWLVTGISEQDERCAQGMLGPGGNFRLEESSFPPDVSCVYEHGTTFSSAGALVWIFWTAFVVLTVSGLGALALELAGVRRVKAASRLSRLAVTGAAALAAVYVLAFLVTGSPKSDPLQTCSAFTTGIYERAQSVHRTPFPAQTTCVYADGRTYDLVPGWTGTLEWTLLAATFVCAAGAVRAGRHADGDAGAGAAPRVTEPDQSR
ncbi:hypothetical protein ACFQ93_37855 [Streptomyces sp. NPDC056601]|uniref:hypothetical protein n=1 Tax=Streptomyces sp. NPDC056601 TaxID=3345875 RepID=UPI00367FE4C1